MGSQANLEYAIIGGGITGLTLAISLHYRGVNVKIYEAARHFGEIGAGVSFSPNAIEAMKICHGGIYEAFEKVCTKNLWPSKQNVWFDYHDGYHDVGDPKTADPAFIISNSTGQRGVHRARFLDELIKLVPEDIAFFSKRLVSLNNDEDGRVTMIFTDGSTATADAVLGCDGIKSRVRQLLYGLDHPCAFPSYTHKYAYRALVPIEDAIAVIGEAKAQNACMHMGPGGHMLTFPVNHGQLVNVVAFHTTENDWPDHQKLTAPSTREEALKDFTGFGKSVTGLLELAKPGLDTWAIFDLGKSPVPKYFKDNVCIIGDAAHATSPHHGAGAGMCIEDAAVMAELLADPTVSSIKDAQLAFEVYDDIRRERTQWLVQSSRFIGDCYEWRAEGVGDDFSKVEAEINRRNGIISNLDVASVCKKAKDQLNEIISRN